METADQPESRVQSISGVVYGASAFFIWGLSPIFWKLLSGVPALETVTHRVIWSFFFLAPFLIIRRAWPELSSVFKKPRILLVLFVTAGFVSLNWLVYIWAINNNLVLQASLGYYINPLVNVLLGMVFLKERLRPAQTIAVILAAAGVLYLTVQYGQFPWVALVLALCFGLYGLIRKVVPVGSLVGLTVETLLLSIPALAYLIYLHLNNHGAFLHAGIKTDLCLMGTALVTALPLLFFTRGARRLHLSTLGFLQYIVPSSFFLLAIFVFGETIARAQIWSFIIIWSALLIYTVDSTIYFRRQSNLLRSGG